MLGRRLNGRKGKLDLSFQYSSSNYITRTTSSHQAPSTSHVCTLTFTSRRRAVVVPLASSTLSKPASQPASQLFHRHPIPSNSQGRQLVEISLCSSSLMDTMMISQCWSRMTLSRDGDAGKPIGDIYTVLSLLCSERMR